MKKWCINDKIQLGFRSSVGTIITVGARTAFWGVHSTRDADPATKKYYSK